MLFTKHILRNERLNKVFIILCSIFINIFRKCIKKEVPRSGNIIIISLLRIGDIIFSIDAINSIIKYHKKKVSIVCYSSTTDILKLVFPDVSIIELTPSDFYYKHKFAKSHVRKMIQQLHPEIIYDLSGSITTASILLTSSTREIIGINLESYKNIYTHYSPIRTKPHVTEIYTDAINKHIPIIKYNYTSLNESENKYILIHPFAGWKAKEWGMKKFIRLSSSINKYTKSYLLVKDTDLTEDIINEINSSKVEVFITLDTKGLIDAVKNCAFLIGNDSGPIHLANLLGKPTFTIYGPTNPEFHKPLNGENRYIIKELYCSAKKENKLCSAYGGIIGCSSFECMNLLKYEDVEKEILDYLKELKIINEI